MSAAEYVYYQFHRNCNEIVVRRNKEKTLSGIQSAHVSRTDVKLLMSGIAHFVCVWQLLACERYAWRS